MQEGEKLNMELDKRVYLAIDLKSFFASVECVERGLDPLSTHLVVADKSRTDKTICLAVSPSLKEYGIAGRARLFEVVQRVKQVNAERVSCCGRFVGKSHFSAELAQHKDWALDYIVAPPHMARYVAYSTRIYGIYLKYVAESDIHVYSIDEVFIDATPYLLTYGVTAHEFALKLVREVLRETGITATAGIGTNLYLAKVAMDIVAKHMPADKDGVRIAELNEMEYRRQLWDFKPITKFWRFGRGIAQRLEQMNLFTMGDIARQSVRNEKALYTAFGVNAELIIDHAWGWEPCTIQDIRAYKPEQNSISRGQVLQRPYSFEQARVVMHEMAENMLLVLLEKKLVAQQIMVDVGYDCESLRQDNFQVVYQGAVVKDHYGRSVPKPAHGVQNLSDWDVSLPSAVIKCVLQVFDRVVNRSLLIRRLTLTAGRVVNETDYKRVQPEVVQLDLFTDYDKIERERNATEEKQRKERLLQQTVLQIKQKMGKNAILSGLNFAEGATMRERNSQIGGHKA